MPSPRPGLSRGFFRLTGYCFPKSADWRYIHLIFATQVTSNPLPFTYKQEGMEVSKPFTDRHLIESLQSDVHRDEAIRFLYRSQFGKCAGYIRQNSGTAEDAEDIFQEVVLAFIEILKRNKFREESSVSHFLHALTRNIWLNELKKRGKSKLRDQIFEKGKDMLDKDAGELIANREMKAELMNLVKTLGDNCKKILLAFYFENQTMFEILQNLEYENEQVVRNKKYKCLKQLEQMISAKPLLAANLKSVLFYE